MHHHDVGYFLPTFPFSTSCNDILIMFVCATYWLSMHLYTLAHMSMHESCLLVCRPYFNTMKLWTSDPNLHLSLVGLFAFLLSCLYVYLCLSCLPPHAMLAISILLGCFCTLLHIIYTSLSFHCLSVGFLALAFACTHMK